MKKGPNPSCVWELGKEVRRPPPPVLPVFFPPAPPDNSSFHHHHHHHHYQQTPHLHPTGVAATIKKSPSLPPTVPRIIVSGGETIASLHVRPRHALVGSDARKRSETQSQTDREKERERETEGLLGRAWSCTLSCPPRDRHAPHPVHPGP